MSSQDLLLGNNYIIQWLALQLCNNLTNNQPINSNQTTNILANTLFNNNDNSNLLATLSNNESHLLNKERPKTNNIVQNKLPPNGCRFNPMRSQQSTQSMSATPKLKSSCPINNSSSPISTTSTNTSSRNPCNTIEHHPKQTLLQNHLVSIKELQPFLNNTINTTSAHYANDNTTSNNNINNLSPSSLANLISLTSNGQIQFLQPRPYQQSANINDAPNLLARLTSPVSPPTPSYNNNGQDNSFDLNSSSLLESLYSMNDEPTDDAINLIAQRTNSTGSDVAQWFQCKREAERNNNYNSHPPNVPSSTLLAKLNAVTSRSDAHILAEKLDQKMVALLEAFYAINDNPEPAAVDMIAKRINTTVEAIGDWFDAKRIETNPNAGPRSPPVKKREGGRVVTFSEYQRSLLEAIFDENNYLHPQEYEELSNLIQVPSRNIKIWFKNRRSKQRLSGRTTTTPGSANNSD